MSTFFSTFVSILIVMPFLVYILVFIISKQLTKEHRFSVRLSLDVSTFFFILSVYYLIFTIWGKSLFWLILLMIIFIGMIVVFIHWKVKEEIDIPKVIRGIWRVNLLVFFSVYVILVFFGVIRSIVHAVS